ncbi:hypothetical protein BaRGS_00018767, partial [Batillaria attramentaria]
YVRTDLYLQTKEVNDAFSLTAKFVLSYGSLFGQLVLNVLTIWALRRHNTANRNVQTSANEEAKAQRERQMTVTILAATICYLSFSFPSVLNNIMTTVYKEYYGAGKYRNIHGVVNSLCCTATDEADIKVECDTFRNGHRAHCFCTLNKAVLDSSKCSMSRSVADVKILLTGKGDSRKMCAFSDYTTGELLYTNGTIATCSLSSRSGDLYTLK